MSNMYQPTVDDEPIWQEYEDILFSGSLDAIKSFNQEHPDKQIAAFGFDSEPHDGYVIIGFETSSNTIKQAKSAEEHEVQNRRKQFASENTWKYTKYYLEQKQPLNWANNTGWFEFQHYREIEFSQWQAFSFADNYPGTDEIQDVDYLSGHVRLIFWKVIERLVEADAFSKLNLWSPFRIGYNFHDEDFVTVRLLNHRKVFESD